MTYRTVSWVGLDELGEPIGYRAKLEDLEKFILTGDKNLGEQLRPMFPEIVYACIGD